MKRARNKRGHQVKQPVLAAGLAGKQVQDRPGDDAEAEAVGDGVGKRDEDQGEKCGDGDQGSCHWISVMAASISDPTRMSAGAVAACGHDADERRGYDGAQKQQAGDDGGYAGASAGSDARRGLHVAGDGGGSDQGAEDGGRGVGKQNLVEAGNGVVGSDEPGAFGDGDQSAQVVEEIDEEEDEDDFEQALADGAADVELQRGLGEGADAADGGRPVHEVRAARPGP